jgi:arylformamidase
VDLDQREVIDISVPISSTAVVYPGDEPLVFEEICSMGKGAAFDTTRLGWTTHFLTHIDPPSHFIEAGESIDQIPVSRFITKALVVEGAGPSIVSADVPSDIRGRSVLYKTRASGWWPAQDFDPSHAYLSAEAATALANNGANLVGIDYLSVDRFGDSEFPAHRILLRSGVLILEGIDLSKVRAGRYTLIALPLKISSGDGSPVRAVLLRG